MKFRDASTKLFKTVSHQDLATKMHVSVASIRQARLNPEAKAHRAPPEGWEVAIAELAGEQIRNYQKLISDLSVASQKPLFKDPAA